METFYQRIKKLDEKYTPRKRGFAMNEEIELIKSTLELEELSVFDLRNIRDMTVLYFSASEEGDVHERIQNMDKLSAITTVIDSILFTKGV